jgi:hypothetical protein
MGLPGPRGCVYSSRHGASGYPVLRRIRETGFVQPQFRLSAVMQSPGSQSDPKVTRHL